MSNNKFSNLGNIIKNLAGVTFTTAAAAYGAQGNPTMAGITTFAAAGITAYDVIRVNVSNLHTQTQQDILIELPEPAWWTSDAASWHGLCAEIVNYFPDIVQTLNDRIQQSQGLEVLTKEVVLHTFAEVLTDILNTKHFTWIPNAVDVEKIAEYIFVPVLEKLGEAFSEEIKRIQYKSALKDTHATAVHTQNIVSLLEGKHSQLRDEDVYEQCQLYCKKIYEPGRMLDFKGIQYTEFQ